MAERSAPSKVVTMSAVANGTSTATATLVAGNPTPPAPPAPVAPPAAPVRRRLYFGAGKADVLASERRYQEVVGKADPQAFERRYQEVISKADALAGLPPEYDRLGELTKMDPVLKGEIEPVWESMAMTKAEWLEMKERQRRRKAATLEDIVSKHVMKGYMLDDMFGDSQRGPKPTFSLDDMFVGEGR